MAEPRTITHAGNAQQRKFRRYALRAPVHITFALDRSVFEIRGVSEDVSEGGFLMTTDIFVPAGCAVMAFVTLPSWDEERPVYLECFGRVARVEERAGSYNIAIKCSGPVSEVHGVSPSVAS